LFVLCIIKLYIELNNESERTILIQNIVKELAEYQIRILTEKEVQIIGLRRVQQLPTQGEPPSPHIISSSISSAVATSLPSQTASSSGESTTLSSASPFKKKEKEKEKESRNTVREKKQKRHRSVKEIQNRNKEETKERDHRRITNIGTESQATEQEPSLSLLLSDPHHDKVS
jgi:hypothetical protein